ncbi:MAG: helix-turn-helix domain-containing protein [Nanoarchaeota archaeon]
MQLTHLREIGLTEGEIKVYQALLELGECTKTALAKTSGVAPSNIYDITNRLIEKGIVSKVEKNGISHFSAANPTHILSFLEQKQRNLEQEKDMVQSILPELLLKFKQTSEKVNVEVFQGWKGIKTVLEDLLSECNKQDKNYVFGASKGAQSEQADRVFLKFSKEREQKGIYTQIIFNENLRNRKERTNFFVKSKLCEVKFLAQSTPAEILLYKNKTCILILTEDPLVIRITGKEVVQSFKQQFDVLWKLGKR